MSGEPKWVRRLARIVLIGRMVRARWSLSRDDSPAVRSVRQALMRAAAGHLSEPERHWIDDIETMRNRLIADPTELTITDHGAGPAVEASPEFSSGARLEVVTVGGRCTASKPKRWALVLFQLLRHLRPTSCLELGTCLGVSAAYQAAALKLNGVGELTTIEGAGSLAELARTNLAQLGLGNVRVVPGIFQEVLPGVLREMAPVDYAFIDGHHDEAATVRYFEGVLPHAAPGAVLVFDDIRWSPGMRRAWNHIVQDPRVARSVDLGPMGICVLSNEQT